MLSVQRWAPCWAPAAILMILLSSLPVSASVSCFVRKHGQYICTFYCQNGFICDNDTLRCLPGPKILENLSQLKEAARQSTLIANRGAVDAERDANSQSTGYDMNETYYIWDGNPREIPSPRYRQDGGFSSGGASRATTSSRAPAKQKPGRITVTPQQKSQLLAFLAAARSFAPNDPNRVGAAKLLQRYVRDNKIPLDVNELLDCGKPKLGKDGQLKSVKLQWGLADILPEIARRKLCDGKSGDELKACQDYQYGQVVMSVEPDLKALCKQQENDFQEKDPEALGLCAENKFRNAWALRKGIVPVQTGGTTIAPAQKCPEIAINDIESLRDRLRKLLGEANPNLPDDSADDTSTADAKPPPPPPVESKTVVEAAPSDDEDPFCAFIARRAVRGELTDDSGDKIPAYCRKAMDAAKSCADQKCSMADIIDRQEHQKAIEPHPWGVEDYQAIEAAQR